jgi:hypothetical protein
MFAGGFVALVANAQTHDQRIATVVSRAQFNLPGATLRYRFELTAVVLDESGWTTQQAVDAIAAGLALLRQCDAGTSAISVLQLRTAADFRDLYTPASRRLAATISLPRPAVFFVARSRNRPAFDAEAFGKGNTRNRPELQDTVWVTREAADLPQTLAHELFHVLANSGTHSSEPDNLMHADTAPQRTRLTLAQCDAMIRNGRDNGLLTPQ